MRIGFATFDWSRSVPDENGAPSIGGAGWYRMMLPMRYLNDQGHDCALGTLSFCNEHKVFFVQNWAGDQIDCDLIVMQRYMHADLIPYMPIARANGQIVVNDLDDWFFGLDKRNHAYEATDPKKNPAVNRDHYAAILAASDVITVTTPFLREQCRKMFPEVRVEMLRNAIDLERWKPNDFTEGRPRVGWVGAGPWRSGDLGTVEARSVGEFCNEHDLNFHHSGQAEPTAAYFNQPDPNRLTSAQREQANEWFSSAGERLGVKAWSAQPMCSIAQYPAMFDAIDVGIVPLADVPFNHAKSAIKGIEYAASGVPFVAQALPEQVYLREHCGIGRTARARSDWVKELRRMLDIEWRRDQREANLGAVAALDIALRGSDWEGLYESLLA